MYASTTLGPGTYFGTLVGVQRRANVILSQTHYAPHQKVPEHCHEQPYFCLTLSGAHRETHRKGDETCVPQSVRFHPAQSVHRNTFGRTGGRCFNFELGPGWRERLAGVALRFNAPMTFSDGLLPSLAYRLYEEFRNEDDVSALAIEGITLEILALLHRADKLPRPARWLNAVSATVKQSYLVPLSLDALATVGGVPPVYLAKAFREAHGCSVGAYIRRLRVDHAMKLMHGGETSLGEIALASGFSDQSHFTKVFKAHTGLTPGQFRNSLR